MADAAVVQSAWDVSSNGILSAVFPSSPTEGNLLILMMLERDVAQGVPSITTAGYTLIDTERFSDLDGTHRRGNSLWYKVAGASENGTVVADWNVEGGSQALFLVELSDVGAYRSNFVYADNGDVLDETVLTSGDLVAAANSVILAFAWYKNQIVSPSADISNTWTNGFIDAGSESGAPDQQYSMAIGAAVDNKASAGTYNTTSTMSATDTSNRNITSMMVEFAGAGVAPPVARKKTMILR
jgi:hypothetical protein